MTVSVQAQVLAGLVGVATVVAGVYLPRRLKRRGRGTWGARHSTKNRPSRDER